MGEAPRAGAHQANESGIHGHWMVTIGRSPLLQYGNKQTAIRH